MLEQKIDDHHVFPQRYLKDGMPDITATLRDCVLNRTLIDKATNVRILKRPPSDYLVEIEGAIGKEPLRRVLESHLLPWEDDSPLRSDNFEVFIKHRQNTIGQKIAEVTE